MADTAAHLVGRVLPDVPVRQWVVTFPWRLHFQLAYDPVLCRAVRSLFLRACSAGGSAAPLAVNSARRLELAPASAGALLPG